MASEHFDDVEIDDVGELTLDSRPIHHSSLNYLYRKNRSVLCIGSSDSINRSTTTLMNNNSHETLGQRYNPQLKPLPKAPSTEPDAVVTTSPARQNVNVKPNYSPSRKLHKRRDIPKEDQYTMFDNDSEDDLDDTVLIYDVPLSQSLVQLTTHQKPIQPRLHSLASDTTHTSSIMSSNYSLDTESDIDSMLFTDAKSIALEMSRSKSVLAIQESAMRRHLIANFDRPKSLDSPLPPSEIKEKLISGTRQVHLPPKDKTEAVKHLKAFQDIKVRAIKNELKNEKETLKQLEKRRKQKAQDLNTWERVVIPNFKQQVQLADTRELWWRGVPPKLRQFIWTEQIGIHLPFEYLSDLKKASLKLIDAQGELVQRIDKDIRSIFPDMPIFQTSLYKDLQLILVMYSQHKSYGRGLSTLAAVLLYNIGDFESTFSCLLGLLQRTVLKLLYNDQKEDFNIEASSFLRTFQKKQPELYHHFQLELKLEPWSYLEPLIKPVFSNHLPLEIVSSILDIYIFEGDAILWRCVLGLFKKIGYKLYGNKQEVLNVIGWDALVNMNKKDVQWYRYLDVGDEAEFIDTVREVLKRK